MRDLNPDPVRSIPLYKVRGRFLFFFFQIFTQTHCDTKMHKKLPLVVPTLPIVRR